MKLKKAIKLLYYRNQEIFGFDVNLPYSINQVYRDVIRHVKLDNYGNVELSGEMEDYVTMFNVVNHIREYVEDWNRCTSQEFISVD